MNKLDNTWCLYLHLPNDIDWSINSYKQIFSFNTLDKCIVLVENINKKIIENSMIFIMKENIKPIWEDEKNCKGGCFSYKILTENIYEIWKKIVYSLIGNTLTSNIELLNSINGISISPKKNFCILKFCIGDIDYLKNNEIFDIITNKLENESFDSEINYNIDPFKLDRLCNIEKLNCMFKKHKIIY